MAIRRDPRLVNNLTSLTVGVLVVIGLCDVAQAQIQFADKTATAGPFHIGESYGASVVDVNGDGRPDIFANNHRLRSGIYRNNGKNSNNNLTFSQSILEVDTSDTEAPYDWGGPDTHGASSADLVVVESGWVHMWKQTPTGATKFTKVSGTLGMACNSGSFGQIADLDADGPMELICVAANGDYPSKIYRTSTVPFQDVTTLLPLTTAVTDAVLADFNNDGRIDLFFTRGKLHVNEVLQLSPTRIEASLSGTATGTGAPPGGIERGFSFSSTGRITITLNTNQISSFDMYFGSGGYSPPGRH